MTYIAGHAGCPLDPLFPVEGLQPQGDHSVRCWDGLEEVQCGQCVMLLLSFHEVCLSLCESGGCFSFTAMLPRILSQWCLVLE